MNPILTKLTGTFDKIVDELEYAYSKHGRERWGRHEFYAILKEEVDELWDDIKADAPQAKVEKEAIQIAAMVFRYLETGDRIFHDEQPEPEQVVHDGVNCGCKSFDDCPGR
jgi:hypothetical protein